MMNMQQFTPKREKGFTLIELVMVIVILGILAAFALPRFADLGGEAETASVEGARGSVKSAMGIVRSTALAQGKGSTSTADTTSPTDDDSVELEGTKISLANGYLAAASVSDAAQIGDFDVVESTGNGVDLAITVDPAETNKPCFNFREATDASPLSEVSSLGEMTSATVCDGVFSN